MALFDIIQGISSSINQFSGGQNGNQLVPPLEVDDSGLIGDGFNWLRSTGDLGDIAGALLQNTYTPVAIRRSLTGLPYGSQRPVNNISTQFRVENKEERDWRVKLLIPIENPIYSQLGSGPMMPLSRSKGIVFPYTPQIETTYTAEYEDLHPTHSNYVTPAYTKSKTDSISIAADFSSNDADEAAYSMAVIHFFRTITKMFYGNDGADNGRPPPILILQAYGAYMFPNVPVVCKSVSFSLPRDVDYVASVPMESIDSGNPNQLRGIDALSKSIHQRVNNILPKILGGQTGSKDPRTGKQDDVSYVPTQFTANVLLQPIYSRTTIAETFSLKKFATGQLTKDGGFV